MPLFQKKVSWILLTILFSFDNIVSYFAIKYWGGHEGNLLIASVVERYPLLYFPCIPLEIGMIFVVLWVIKQILLNFFKKWKNNEDLLKRIILGTIVIYWAVGNSAMNLFFLLGLRLPIHAWLITSILGISLALIYFFAIKEDLLLHNTEQLAAG